MKTDRDRGANQNVALAHVAHAEAEAALKKAREALGEAEGIVIRQTSVRQGEAVTVQVAPHEYVTIVRDQSTGLKYIRSQDNLHE
jgi:hypothetical protein